MEVNHDKAPPEEERLRILRDLDVEAFNQWMLDTTGNAPATEKLSLLVMHRGRYSLGMTGMMDKRRMIDSRRWLVMNGYKLPETK